MTTSPSSPTVCAGSISSGSRSWLMYEVEHIGGLPLLCVLYVLLTVAAFAGAVAAARRLGGEDLHVLEATLPGAFFYLVTALSIRTQGLAYPLFVTTVWLLASDLRSASAAAACLLGLPDPGAVGQPARLGDAGRGPRRALRTGPAARQAFGAAASAGSPTSVRSAFIVLSPLTLLGDARTAPAWSTTTASRC